MLSNPPNFWDILHHYVMSGTNYSCVDVQLVRHQCPCTCSSRRFPDGIGQHQFRSPQRDSSAIVLLHRLASADKHIIIAAIKATIFKLIFFIFQIIKCFASLMLHKHKKVAIRPISGMNCNIL